MIIKCKCGCYTTNGKNCSKCQDLDITSSVEADFELNELEVHTDKIDQEVLDFIEAFNKKYKKEDKNDR